MGLFHKTLKNAISALEKGKAEEAKNILLGHISAVATVTNTNSLKLLESKINGYLASLDEAYESLKKGDQKGALEFLRGADVELQSIKRKMKRMIDKQLINLD